MRITWANPSFLHYRIPVYAELSALVNGEFHLVFSATRTPDSVRTSIAEKLGTRAVGLAGECCWQIGRPDGGFANSCIRIVYQPGLRTAIRKTAPHVIICEGFYQYTPAALSVARDLGSAVVIAYERTAHTERRAGRLRTWYRRWVCRHVQAIACNGSLSKRYCVDVLGMAPERVFVGAMAADSDLLSMRCDDTPDAHLDRLLASLKLTRPLFMFVGRLTRAKGVAELLHGWSVHCLCNPLSAGSLLLVGDGPEHQDLEAKVKELELRNVVFTGEVPYRDMGIFYRLCDVLIMPTLEDNWSLVVPEAMACGRPVLCSKYNGCWPELVKEGQNGAVFDPYNPFDVARAIAITLSPFARTEMGKASREIAASYSPIHAAASILEACSAARGCVSSY